MFVLCDDRTCVSLRTAAPSSFLSLKKDVGQEDIDREKGKFEAFIIDLSLSFFSFSLPSFLPLLLRFVSFLSLVFLAVWVVNRNPSFSKPFSLTRFFLFLLLLLLCRSLFLPSSSSCSSSSSSLSSSPFPSTTHAHACSPYDSINK